MLCVVRSVFETEMAAKWELVCVKQECVCVKEQLGKGDAAASSLLAAGLATKLDKGEDERERGGIASKRCLSSPVFSGKKRGGIYNPTCRWGH